MASLAGWASPVAFRADSYETAPRIDHAGTQALAARLRSQWGGARIVRATDSYDRSADPHPLCHPPKSPTPMAQQREASGAPLAMGCLSTR